MANPDDAIQSQIARKAGEMAVQEMVGISIAVLGPGLNADTAGSRKRRQIRAELEQDGHKPFFPECHVAPGPTREALLEQERRLLGGPDVHLVIILHTSGHGAPMEIAYFMQMPEIRDKSALLFPIKYYTPDESLVANTVREYHTRMLYSEEQFDACQIVAECRKWARDLATGRWPSIAPFRS